VDEDLKEVNPKCRKYIWCLIPIQALIVIGVFYAEKALSLVNMVAIITVACFTFLGALLATLNRKEGRSVFIPFAVAELAGFFAMILLVAATGFMQYAYQPSSLSYLLALPEILVLIVITIYLGYGLTIFLDSFYETGSSEKKNVK